MTSNIPFSSAYRENREAELETLCFFPTQSYLFHIVSYAGLHERTDSENAYSIVQGALPCKRKSKLSPTHKSLRSSTATILALSTTSTTVRNSSESLTICSHPLASSTRRIVTSCRPISFSSCSGISSVTSFDFVVIVCVVTVVDAGLRTLRVNANGATPLRWILASLNNGESRQSDFVLGFPKLAEGRECTSCSSVIDTSVCG